MKGIHFILNLLLSAVLIFAPATALAFEMNHENMEKASCCTEMPGKTDEVPASCHDIAEGDHPHNSCSDKCGNCCADHACQIHVQTLQIPALAEFDMETFELINTIQNTEIQSLTLQNFIVKFWNPPKYI